MNNKIFIALLIAIICTGAVFFFWYQKNNSAASQTISPILADSPQPTSSPSPLVVINNQSNLASASSKLQVPEFSGDYQKLDQSLANF